MSRLVRLYPRDWRDRYETEFLDLIEARPPSAAERFDILRGALDARLHPQLRVREDGASLPPLPDDDLRIARRLGFVGLIGAVLWPVAFAVILMGPVRYDDQGAYRDGAAALPILLLSVALLAAGLLGHLVRLPADAIVARASAMAAIPLLLVWAMGPWLWPIGLLAIGFVATLAAAGRRSGVWPLGASLTVVAACLGVLVIGAVGAASAGGDRMAGGALFVLAALVLVPGWLGVGATLIRRPVTPNAAAA